MRSLGPEAAGLALSEPLYGENPFRQLLVPDKDMCWLIRQGTEPGEASSYSVTAYGSVY